MQHTYCQDRNWSDQYLDQVKQLIAPHLISVAGWTDDCLRATDLQSSAKRIAVRLRRGPAGRYKNEFTLRSHRDWVLSDLITDWYLLDLNVFRASWFESSVLAIEHVESNEVSNGDGTSFRWFKINSFPASLVIASSETDERYNRFVNLHKKASALCEVSSKVEQEVGLL